jgi:outer membrane protein insertion porin family
MQLIYKRIFFIITILFSTQFVNAQIDTTVSVDPELINIFNSKTPKEYTIAGITVGGTKAFDQNLIISISGIAVGDKVLIPGTDVFSKAIAKLWKQSLISNIEISFTKLVDRNLYIHFEITERPRLAEFKFVGVKKGERDDLETKVALVKERVVTENMKLSAVEAIRKFYSDKGYRNVDIQMKEEVVATLNNSVSLTFYVTKGNKVKINSVNFSGNETLAEQKLKKQMKGTKEMPRFTLYPISVKNPYGDSAKKTTFKEYINDAGFLSISKTKAVLDPYVRLKLSSGKFSDKKYGEDKESVLDYYN